jgi:hypothetical protein
MVCVNGAGPNGLCMDDKKHEPLMFARPVNAKGAKSMSIENSDIGILGIIAVGVFCLYLGWP